MGYGGKEVKQLKKGEHNHTGRQRKFLTRCYNWSQLDKRLRVSSTTFYRSSYFFLR